VKVRTAGVSQRRQVIGMTAGDMSTKMRGTVGDGREWVIAAVDG